jgi:GH25 family lysozyme M1 (1,4-beta-N-acetylmuramidase)
MKSSFAVLALSAISIIFNAESSASEFSKPWLDADVAIVLDPFEGNSMDWDKIASEPRVIGVIHRATFGLSSDAKYAVRKTEAKARGLKWGAYHLLTTADPEDQVDHFLSVTGLDAADAYALDIECLDTLGGCAQSIFKVSAAQIEAAIAHFKAKTGRLPLIYANGSVTDVLASKLNGKPELSGLNLWYARFKNTLTNFPAGLWPSYTLWQFSSEINCEPSPGQCPFRVQGTKSDMDVNAFNGTVAEAKAAWPMN